MGNTVLNTAREPISNSGITDKSDIPDTSIMPEDTSAAATIPNSGPQPSIPPQMHFYGDYSTLEELIALSWSSEQEIESKISEIQDSFSAHPYEYHVNFEYSPNRNRSSDLEIICQLLQMPLFPLIESINPIEIGINYTFYDPPSYGISLRYEIDEVVYIFAVSDIESEDAIRYFEREEYWELELLHSEDDIRVFLKKTDDTDSSAYNHGVPEQAIAFGMDVKGSWVDVIVFRADDDQSVFGSILSFEFGALLV